MKQNILASKRREQELQKSLDELTKKSEAHENALRKEVHLLEEERENAQGWKRALYDEARPASTAFMTDEVQDLTILVEHQKKENESISKQLQLAKEEGFASAAKVGKRFHHVLMSLFNDGRIHYVELIVLKRVICLSINLLSFDWSFGSLVDWASHCFQ